MRRNSLILWSLGLGMALTAGAGAKTIHVATTGNDATGDGSQDHPYRTIQKGIDQAAASGDKVKVAAGTYRENIVWDSKSLVLVGAGAGNTIVEGGGVGSCFTLTNVPDTARMTGFTIQYGYEDYGGGLNLSSSAPTLSDNEILNNYASTSGGGVYLDNSPATLTGNQVRSNWADDDGGGIYLASSDATLTNNQVKGNGSDDGGGGIYLYDSSATLINNRVAVNRAYWGGGMALEGLAATLTDNQVESNAADWGGGIYLWNSDSLLTGNQVEGNFADSDGGGVYLDNSPATLTGNGVRSNWAYDDGGGIYLYYSDATLTNNQVKGNGSGYGGGGMYLYYSSATLTNNRVVGNLAEWGGGMALEELAATLTDNQVEGNVAIDWGGGIYLWNSDSLLTGNGVRSNWAYDDGGGIYLYYSDATLTSNGIRGNGAGGDGGGIYLYYSNARLRNNPVTDNSASGEAGGGYLYFSAATLTNNTVADNTGEGIYGDNSNPTITNCILWNNSGAGDLVNASATYSDVGTGNTAGTGNMSADPQFVGPGNYHLQPVSPCINKGDNGAPDLPAEDIDGQPRIMHSTVDLGADEARLPWQPDLWIKQGNNWLGEQVFNGDGTGQTGRRTVPTGGTAVYKARLYNQGKKTETFWIKGPSGNKNWQVRYYRGTKVRKDREVTDQVTSSQGWKRPNVPVGGNRTFLIQVTAKSGVDSGRYSALVKARSKHQPTHRDCLKVVTKVK